MNPKKKETRKYAMHQSRLPIDYRLINILGRERYHIVLLKVASDKEKTLRFNKLKLTRGFNSKKGESLLMSRLNKRKYKLRKQYIKKNSRLLHRYKCKHIERLVGKIKNL